MKILVQATLYPEGVNDKRRNTTMFMHYYAAEWVKQGHEVLVIHHKVEFPEVMVKVGRGMSRALKRLPNVEEYLSGYGQDGDAEFERDGVNIVRRRITKYLPRRLFSEDRLARRAGEVRRILAARSFSPDIVLCDFTNPGLYVANLMRGELRAPVVSILHGTDMEYFARPATSERAIAALRRADMVAFRSNNMREAFTGAYYTPERYMIMPSGIPAGVVEGGGDFSPRTRVRGFLCVARLQPAKHVDAVIRAFIAAGIEGASLKIIGVGSQMEELAALAEGRSDITFTGQLPREQVFECMRAADCFVLVSEKESFGMVYIEAMSAGAIPVGSVGVGAADLIERGVNGYLINGHDEDELRQVMLELAGGDEDRISRMSSAARETCAEMRDDLLAERAIETYDGLIQECDLHGAGDKV